MTNKNLTEDILRHAHWENPAEENARIVEELLKLPELDIQALVVPRVGDAIVAAAVLKRIAIQKLEPFLVELSTYFEDTTRYGAQEMVEVLERFDRKILLDHLPKMFEIADSLEWLGYIQALMQKKGIAEDSMTPEIKKRLQALRDFEAGDIS